MTDVDFVDQTLRDGQQSLWGMRMRAYQCLPILPDLADTGFAAIDLTGSMILSVIAREFRDDPWETLDLQVAGLGNNQIRASMRGNSTVEFRLTPYSLLDLFAQTFVKHGVTAFWLYDCLYGMVEMRRMVEVMQAAGAEVLPAIMYGISDVHTDQFFADRAREMASWPGVKSIYFEDAPGVLTPERASTLLPALVEAAGDVQIELHSHTTTGLAYLVYLEGLKHGIRTLHTASRPLANGPSLPSTEGMVDLLAAAGYSHQLDVDRLLPVATHLEREALAAGYELGVPLEFSLRPYQHQLPGGMTGTLKQNLAQHGMTDRLDATLEEIAKVHIEMGTPVMATPFSQLIGIQSVLNVVSGDRYSVVPDEVFHYVFGHYGQPPAPIDPNVKDKIMSSPRAKDFENWERPQPSIEEIRRRLGGHLRDEELLLRALMAKEHVDAMLAAGPVPRDPRHAISEIVNTVRELAAEGRDARRLRLSQPGLSLDLRRTHIPKKET
jgi:oxaloacetate decarboxylase (Na+ extruding) subunit alpha